MEDYFSEDVNEMLEKSLSQINSSLEHLLNTVNKLEYAVIKQDWFSQNDIFIVKRDIEIQSDSISELERIIERKRNAFIIIKN
ncbi:hypothetical protein ACFVSW_17745 [Neobacillus sp. NPDC058068]|uniref:hypothetical protein n=1 Tax=Neobacillus sp. NPDC058068 TaxID=3346325 RepID=UPI0036DC1E56